MTDVAVEQRVLKLSVVLSGVLGGKAVTLGCCPGRCPGEQQPTIPAKVNSPAAGVAQTTLLWVGLLDGVDKEIS
jgi:hypothetical protein